MVDVSSLQPFAPIIGGGINAIANWFGGQQQREATQEANALNIAWQNAFRQEDRTWDTHWRHVQLQEAEKERARQKEFAQMGIQWKAADAAAAGIHPAYALGANTATPSAISIQGGGGMSGATPNFRAATSGNAFAGLGQDISRAIMATQNAEERTAAALRLENMGLQNDLLRVRIKNAGQLGPGTPSESPWLGSGDVVTPEGVVQRAAAQKIEEKPMERTGAGGPDKSKEPGAIVYSGYSWTGTGWEPVPAKDYKERTEDSPQEYMKAFRDLIEPMIPGGRWRPPFEAPAGKEWEYVDFEYRLVPAGTGRGRNIFSFRHSPTGSVSPRSNRMRLEPRF